MAALARWTWRLIVAIAILLLVVLVAATLLQVLSRYVLQQPFDWTEEVARYIFVWLAMIGAGIAARDRAHFFVDALVDLLPLRARRVVAITVGVFSSIFLLVISWAALELALGNSVQTSPVLGLPMSVPYFALPVGFILMAIFTVVETIGDFHRDFARDAGAGEGGGLAQDPFADR